MVGYTISLNLKETLERAISESRQLIYRINKTLGGLSLRFATAKLRVSLREKGNSLFINLFWVFFSVPFSLFQSPFI